MAIPTPSREEIRKELERLSDICTKSPGVKIIVRCGHTCVSQVSTIPSEDEISENDNVGPSGIERVCLKRKRNGADTPNKKVTRLGLASRKR